MHIAFIGLPLSGHINPTLEVVRELIQRGHRVTYPTTSPHHDQVAATGADVPIYRSTLGTDVPGRDQWMTQMRIAMVDEAAAILPQVLDSVDRSDLVVHDRAAFTGRLLAAAHQTQIVQVVTSFAANQHWAVTHNFAPIAQDTPEFRLYQEKLDRLVPDFSRLPQYRQQIAFLPKAFQYKAETFGDETVFVGPCLRPAPGEWKPPGDGKPILLISMGSVNTAHPDFYRRCINAFDDRWHVVMAIGDRVDEAGLGPIPTHVEVMRYVPQLDVLPHAAAMMCHAGMGSTMEALAFGVPLVHVPLTPEQEANAARLVELGLGVRIDPDDDLRTAVETAAGLRMTAAVEQMREEIRKAGGASRAADVIEANAP